MAFNFSENNFAQIAEQGYEFEVTHPFTGEGIDCYITVRGDLSPITKKFNKNLATKLQWKEIQKKQRKGNKEEPFDLEEALQVQRDQAISRVISWRGIEYKGRTLESTEEDIKLLLNDPDFSWLCEQIVEEASTSVNFS